MTKPRTRLEAKARQEILLQHAVAIATRCGYQNVTRPAIAEAAGVQATLVSYHFGTMAQFRRTLMRYAVQHAGADAGARRVVLQGILAGDKQALKCAPDTVALAKSEMVA